MENRFPTMTEVRTVLWPNDGTREWSGRSVYKGSPARVSYSTAPRSTSSKLPEKRPAALVAVFQRIDQAGFKQPIDERILADADTFMVFGLDHAGRSGSHPRVAQTRGNLSAARSAPQFHR
jgi:hypothetical protein